ncbi:transposase [Halomonas sp.]|uniref:transposase n=1 Tax=Halomonas sp. TaxID=1486246 RepID=UPI00298DBC64|nr:transposase [Halomonas sp.]MDW7749121.1 transposase [Halomonas sp.]
MPRYSEERRQAVVAKLLPPHNLSPQVIAEQEGISLGTVYKWRKEARAEGRCLPDALGKGADGWSSKDKFSAVLETASMNAQETAEFCRRRGIYPEQLERWRHDCEQAASLSHSERQREADEAKQQRKRIKALEKELARKNEALAETAALLALRNALGLAPSCRDRNSAAAYSQLGCQRRSRPFFGGSSPSRNMVRAAIWT